MELRPGSLAMLLILSWASACANGRAYQGKITWPEIERFAEITFHDGTTDGNIIRIPYDLKLRTGDSLHVLNFEGCVSGDTIQLSARMGYPSDRGTGKNEVHVSSTGQLRHEYWLVYRNPDGSWRHVSRIQIESENGTSSFNDDQPR